MFDASDLRATLPTAGLVRGSSGPASPAECVVLADIPRHPDGPNIDSWYVRGQNFIVNHAVLRIGAELSRDVQSDEYMVILPESTMGLRVATENETAELWGPRLIIVPPGPSRLIALADGSLSRLLTTRADDLLGRCHNASSYADRKANVAEYTAWPAPTDGYRLRSYAIDVPETPGRFGRIWRCSTFMVNILPTWEGPRDPSKLSPHSHDDFEQCSLGLSGDFLHHLRWPWTPDVSQWRDDQHLLCPSPSVTVIPPPVLHTTQATGPASNVLVDIFSPPRRDFSDMPGWVLNADEYPMPIIESAQAF